MKIVRLILSSLLFSASVYAETLEVEYASFYSHVKKLDDPDTHALRFAFGFWHIHQARLCHVSEAKIVTQKQQIPLVVENNGRFTVPIDKILKMARATVKIELADQANQCDMSVQLETLPSYLKVHYSNSELLMLLAQYQTFFNDIGGFLSFMMPSVQGLSIQLKTTDGLANDLKDLLNEQGNLLLSNEWIEQGNTLTLPTKPLRITAIIDE